MVEKSRQAIHRNEFKAILQFLSATTVLWVSRKVLKRWHHSIVCFGFHWIVKNPECFHQFCTKEENRPRENISNFLDNPEDECRRYTSPDTSQRFPTPLTTGDSSAHETAQFEPRCVVNRKYTPDSVNLAHYIRI